MPLQSSPGGKHDYSWRRKTADEPPDTPLRFSSYLPLSESVIFGLDIHSLLLMIGFVIVKLETTTGDVINVDIITTTTKSYETRSYQ